MEEYYSFIYLSNPGGCQQLRRKIPYRRKCFLSFLLVDQPIQRASGMQKVIQKKSHKVLKKGHNKLGIRG